LEQYSRCVVS